MMNIWGSSHYGNTAMTYLGRALRSPSCLGMAYCDEGCSASCPRPGNLMPFNLLLFSPLSSSSSSASASASACAAAGLFLGGGSPPPLEGRFTTKASPICFHPRLWLAWAGFFLGLMILTRIGDREPQVLHHRYIACSKPQPQTDNMLCSTTPDFGLKKKSNLKQDVLRPMLGISHKSPRNLFINANHINQT